jgi:hypothetical protein
MNFRVIITDSNGEIPVNLNNNKKIKYINGKIYPKMFDQLYII